MSITAPASYAAELTLARLSELAATHPGPWRMRSEVLVLSMALRMQHGYLEALPILRQAHEGMAEAVAAAERAVAALDPADAAAQRRSRASLAVLVAARDALEREAMAPA